MTILKKYWGIIALSIVLVALDIWSKEVFYTQFLAYYFFIKFLLSERMAERTRKIVSIAIWSIFIFAGATMFYVNNYMPHGPMIDTGDVVCQNDDHGPCGEKYIEDTRRLNIPDWAKFFRTSEAELLMLGLVFAGIVVSTKGRE